MDLRNTALLLVAERANQRDHIQAKLPVRQRPPSFFFWTAHLMEGGTLAVPTDAAGFCNRSRVYCLVALGRACFRAITYLLPFHSASHIACLSPLEKGHPSSRLLEIA
jgi:hypothetical protein